MSSYRCMAPFQTQTARRSGELGSPRGDDNTADLVFPKAKVQFALELDLGSGCVNITDSSAHRSHHIHDVDEIAKCLSMLFGSRKTNFTGSNDDIQGLLREVRTRIKKCLCDDSEENDKDAEIAKYKQDIQTYQSQITELQLVVQKLTGKKPVDDLSQCRATLATLKKRVKDTCDALREDAGKEHHQVVRLAMDLAEFAADR
jgi:hypothetical protein